MGRTEIFISSTCFDLSQVRRDLENAIVDLGHTPILSDSKDLAIPPGLDNIEICKWLVKSSDIYVLIIGGRYGSTDKDTGKSISTIEYDTAVESNIPIYIFVDKEVWIKTDTYKQLKDMVIAGDLGQDKLNEALGGKIEDVRVFEFINYIKRSGKNNWIFPFDDAKDIIDTLKNNFSFLLKKLLEERKPEKSQQPVGELKPIPELFWKSDNNEPVQVIHVPPLSDLKCDEILSSLKLLKFPKDKFKILQTKKKEIHELLRVFGPEKLGLIGSINNYDLILNLIEEWDVYIGDIINMTLSDFGSLRKYYKLSERSIKPDFYIVNNGNTPSLNTVVYLSPSEKIKFCRSEEINEQEIIIPEKFSNKIDSILNFIKIINEHLAIRGLASTIQIVERINDYAKPHSKLIDALQSQTSSSNSVFSKLLSTSKTTIDPKDSLSLENNDIRIDIYHKIKHNFQYIIDNKEIFICNFLENGDEETLKYVSHADNLPEPIEGNLKIIAK